MPARSSSTGKIGVAAGTRADTKRTSARMVATTLRMRIGCRFEDTAKAPKLQAPPAFTVDSLRMGEVLSWHVTHADAAIFCLLQLFRPRQLLVVVPDCI